ncbi:MAG: cell envelope-related function transcriptional attenuator common domain protein [Bacillales bacterium]|jgi:LCP family protein required for cell wall assembly|nr:cell envelope-related function transcriptional attenuator common domain protein [Bacillales bacterium]
MRKLVLTFILPILLLFSGCSLKNTTDLLNIGKKSTSVKDFQGSKNADHRLNILLVGIDSRGEKHSRSDAIMIVQYNPKTNEIRLVSIMRDSYVAIPTYKHKYHKINTAYYLGGPELLRKTIKQNFGIEINHYVTIDFKGFEKIVDLIAPEGVQVNVTQNIIKDMKLNLQPGVQKLHGKELLAYARFRHDAESDFGRVARQQEIITALKDAAYSRLSNFDAIVKVPNLINEGLQYVETSFSMQDILSLGTTVVMNPVKTLESMRIPLSNTFENARFDHAGLVLQIDENKNRQALKEFLIEKPTPVNK